MQGLEKLIGHNDMMAYLTMMTVRLIELHRVLKETGTIFLHCDTTASHYLKLVLDAIFGIKQFRNEIIWRRGKGATRTDAAQFPRNHDTILFYSKSDKWGFKRQFKPYADKTLAMYSHDDEDGRGVYRTQELRTYGKDTIEKFRSENKIYTSSTGREYLKQYLTDKEGVAIDSVWEDIGGMAHGASGESLGYPTQKPLALLERIINAVTKEGDWILDPFGGCGTTAVAAEKLKRKWVIIDITTLAINLVRRRIEDLFPDIIEEMSVDGYPADFGGAQALFEQDPFEFEYWCCDLVNARPAGDKTKGSMKGADRGIDGVITFGDGEMGKAMNEYRKLLVQVKGGHVGAAQVRDLVGTVQREKAAGGIFISLEEPTKPMLKDATEAGTYTYNLTGQKYPVIQCITVKELMNGKRPEHPSAMGYAKKAEKVNEDERTSMF